VLLLVDTVTGMEGWKVEKLSFAMPTRMLVAMLVLMVIAEPPEVAERVKLVVVGVDCT
jgi:hypothetical protein